MKDKGLIQVIGQLVGGTIGEGGGGGDTPADVYTKSQVDAKLAIKTDKTELQQAVNDLTIITNDIYATKQAKLTSGQTIKTINNVDILGSGNIDIDCTLDAYTKQEVDDKISPINQRSIENSLDIADHSTRIEANRTGIENLSNAKADKTVIITLDTKIDEVKTKVENIPDNLIQKLQDHDADIALNTNNINMLKTTKLDSTEFHDLEVEVTNQGIELQGTKDAVGYIRLTELPSKQDKLTSGTNIKTINGDSVLGSGDLGIHIYNHIINISSYQLTITNTQSTPMNAEQLFNFLKSIPNHRYPCTGATNYNEPYATITTITYVIYEPDKDYITFRGTRSELNKNTTTAQSFSTKSTGWGGGGDLSWVKQLTIIDEVIKII